ncbi:uncharacterized protein LOC116295139 [Actinia tenebrosa]|uniref:Uncharacterized protein LOC116295139 n=1 Tax=Actinia tenebrosa TaxID=6105 RepID=A0A6P8HTK7_ACTTE|nr:uncharacterized protein LOC116295139 [Actinia tenebrosa]
MLGYLCYSTFHYRSMELRRIVLLIYSSLSITFIIQCHCACPSCETVHFNANQNVMLNFAMEGREIDSENVSSVFECFIRCHKNCLCESFNFWRRSQSGPGGVCELNRADIHGDPSAVKPTNGSLFFNLQRQVAPGCPSCSSRLSCCSSSNPCYNGRCIDSCSEMGKRYKCKCFPNFSGYRCQHFMDNS